MKAGKIDNLKKYYDGIYAGDKSKHFLKYSNGELLSEAHLFVKNWISENVPNSGNILDFGCGEADFLGLLYFNSDIRRIGIDFSHVALETAAKRYPFLELVLGGEEKLSNFENAMDIVVSFGTIEHLDNPKDTFRKLMDSLKSRGFLILSCPSFFNVRGIIWMALVKLFNVPMSLSDKHFLSLYEFKNWAEEIKLELVDFKTVNFAPAHGKSFRKDMFKRLTNALNDSGMDSNNVEELIQWVENNSDYFPFSESSGIEALYFFRKY